MEPLAIEVSGLIARIQTPIENDLVGLSGPYIWCSICDNLAKFTKRMEQFPTKIPDGTVVMDKFISYLQRIDTSWSSFQKWTQTEAILPTTKLVRLFGDFEADNDKDPLDTGTKGSGEPPKAGRGRGGKENKPPAAPNPDRQAKQQKKLDKWNERRAAKGLPQIGGGKPANTVSPTVDPKKKQQRPGDFCVKSYQHHFVPEFPDCGYEGCTRPHYGTKSDKVPRKSIRDVFAATKFGKEEGNLEKLCVALNDAGKDDKKILTGPAVTAA
jgi:hypothetical protein